MDEYKKKILIITLGVFLSIALLEVILRIFGVLYVRNVKTKKVKSRDQKKYVVLCLGDSFTYGLGAPLGESYVDYLRVLLQQKFGRDKVEVVNYGFPGHNTHQLIEILRDEVDRIKPDLVIFLAGCQNLYNFYGYYDFTKRKRMNYVSLFKWLHNFKVYKLVRLLLDDLRYINHSSKKYKNNIQFDSTEMINDMKERVSPNSVELSIDSSLSSLHKFRKLGKALISNDTDEETYFEIGDYYFHRRLYDKAADWYMKGIKSNPQSIKGYIKMSDLENKRGNWNQVIKYSRMAIKLGANDGEVYMLLAEALESVNKIEEAVENYKIALKLGFQPANFIYKRLACIYQNSRQYKEALDFFTKIAKFDPAAISYMYRFQNRSNYYHLIEEWIGCEIADLKKICEDRNILLIIQNYPALNGYRWISFLLKDIAKRENCLFVDQYSFFEDMQDKENFFNFDHCNSQGYKIMAKNLFNKIVEDNLIKIDNK
ncbi:hypothetical protein J7K25_05155 [bacterium]|nr:hypothetical protein [bacterium]